MLEGKKLAELYPIYIFFSVITFLVIRQYTNAKQLYIEAQNRLAMVKMLAHINAQKENTENKQYFLPALVEAIVYSTRKERTGNAASLLEQLMKLLKPKN